MTVNCQALGLKCGIEIHQQLDTKKLFCSCPSTIRDDKADVLFIRRLRASAGETGEVDAAAMAEQHKQKSFLYQAYSDSTCLVEYDCEPIHGINDEALKICLQVALMLGAKPVDSIQVMRKTVVDGSNTSGFQRTALIARDGMLGIARGNITIPTVCLEEEAAKIVERTPDTDVYNLSRLGIPLVEIATGPEIVSPEEAREAAEKLGMILRSTGKVKRGLGTIRQDVNVSIKGGARIEIKGAQDLKLITLLIENECSRQAGLIDIREELKKRRAHADDKIVDASAVMQKCESKLISAALKNGAVLGVKLSGFAGLLGKELMPGRRFGTELSDYAKAASGVGGIFHSDELPKYGISAEEVAALEKKLGCHESDAFVIVADTEERAKRAVNAVIARAGQALHDLPKEVRKANDDGTTSYMRPIPGASRMYPETDCITIRPDVRGIKLPKLITEKARDYEAMGLSKDLSQQMSKSDRREFFEEMAGKYTHIEPVVIASTLLLTPKEIKTRFGLDASAIKDKDYLLLFDYLNQGKISKNAIVDILADCCKTGAIDVKKYEQLSEQELRKEIKELASQNKGVSQQALMGIVMAKFRGKADGKLIAELVREFLN